VIRQTKLAKIQYPSLNAINAVLDNVENVLEQHSTQNNQTQSTMSEALKIYIRAPVPLDEL